jgi:hypothetical protein
MEAVLWQRVTVGANERGIGELEARRVVSGRRAVEQDRPLTAELQSVAGDEAGIGSEVALFLRARHLTRELTDDELVIEVSGDHRRPD